MIDFVLTHWRDAIFLLVALTGVYLVNSLRSLSKVGQQRNDTDGLAEKKLIEPVLPPFEATPSAAPLTTRDFLQSMRQTEELPEVSAPPRKRFFAATPLQEAPEPPQPAFALELTKSSVEVELQQLRRESSALREELLRVREELAGIKASRNVSPLYGEAMSLAQRGVTADGIAVQCGISLGEAELVAALARGDAIGGALDPDDKLEPRETRHGRKPDPRTGTHG